MASTVAHPITLYMAVNTVGDVDSKTNPDGVWIEILPVNLEDPSL